MGDGSISAVILAGGKSRRFGSDKASALLLGRPMLQWVASALDGVCNELVIVIAAGQVLPPFESAVPVRVVTDRYSAKGPLAGLATGFAAVSAPLCFATSCDAPLLHPGLVRMLAAIAAEEPNCDVICPFVAGYLQPLAAVYRPPAVLSVFEELIARGMLTLTAALDSLQVRIVAEADVLAVDPGLASFVNANQPAILHEIAERLRSRSAGSSGDTP